MIMMDLRDVIRDILGSYRVQFLILPESCTGAEASALDFQFRDQLYESFDYAQMAERMSSLVPEDGVIDYKDDFGLHYLILRGRNSEQGSVIFFGPYTYRSYGEEEYLKLQERHSLPAEALEAIRWYFKRIPVILDYLSWQHLFTGLLARYLAFPDLEIKSVSYDHPETVKQKPTVSLSSIPYTSVEARYEVENRMLEAIRRGDISEATYQQNLFMGFSLDQRISDRIRDAKDMIIAVNTNFRKAIEQAAVHPLYIDAISGQFVIEIEQTDTMDQLQALIPKMIRHYCLLVQRHSMINYSQAVRDCLNYINFHYSEPLSLETLAGRFSVNKNYLSSRFHTEVRQTVTEYINQTRIQHAAELLGKTALSIQEIAEQCGFTDGNYLTRIFKKIHGMTPNEYRKSLAAGGGRERTGKEKRTDEKRETE
jgi:AraC-like DNA-binding protein